VVGSQPGGAHETPVVDWIAVYVMLAGAIGLGLALPLKSWWFALGGGLLFLIGAGMALGYGIMNHTEDYDVRPQDETDDRDEPAQSHRIISA
jgi:hypothetical protein